MVSSIAESTTTDRNCPQLMRIYVELSAIKSKIKELLPMGPKLAEIQSVLATQDESLTAVESLSKTTASRLDEVLEKLKKSFFFRGKFKS